MDLPCLVKALLESFLGVSCVEVGFVIGSSLQFRLKVLGPLRAVHGFYKGSSYWITG